jgi:hypothetical protein
LVLLLLPTSFGQSLPTGRPLAIAVHEGRCECVLSTARPDDKFILIIGSLSRNLEPVPVIVQTEATNRCADMEVERRRVDGAWRRHVQELHERLADARRERSLASALVPPREPPSERVFSLFVRDQEFQDPAAYVTVKGDLRGFGRHCQVYLDRDYPDPPGVQPTVEDIVRTFDDDVSPQALGQVLDVDRDGRFTILLTSWLGKLCNGKVAVGGFVRGSDFMQDLPAPFGNRCDMMYLNANLKPGPYLHTLLAHEYTHAIVFSEHVFGNYLAEAVRQDEQSWLNEALAHLEEDRHAYSWSNLDYRVSAFLNAPERQPLVVPDAYGAGLWRSPGHRGAAYLFVRWCTDRYGPDLPAQLIRTNLSGVANVEAATQEPFPDLFRQWTIALAMSGTGQTVDGVPMFKGFDLHRPVGDRLLCGPRFQELSLAGGQLALPLAGTAAAYVALHSPGGGHTQLIVTSKPEADLQVSLIRLPEATGRLSVQVVPVGSEQLAVGSRDGQVPTSHHPLPTARLRLVLAAHDAAVTLDQAAWERQAPAGNHCDDTSYRKVEGAQGTVDRWFRDTCLQAGTSRTSEPITVPECNGPVVFKVSGTDEKGHTVAAWAVMP